MISVFTSRKSAGSRQQEAETKDLDDQSRFIRAFEESGRGWFWEVDAAGYLTHFSTCNGSPGAGGNVLGRKLSDLTRQCWDEFSEGIGTERTLNFHLSRGRPFTELTVKSAENPEVLWSLTGQPVFSEDQQCIGFRGFGSDLSEQTKAEAELRKAARFDSLTGLPNRATILRCLEEGLRSKRHGDCALVIIDLDRFKEVNDTLGHLVGDAVLRQAARRIEQIWNKAGSVGRLGGDEFEVVITAESSPEAIEELATRCITYLSQPYVVDTRTISIGASIGVAFGNCAKEDAESLFRKADLALYSAKNVRGTTRFFQPEMEMVANNRQVLEHDLRTALASGELEVFLQPVISTTSETLAGFEALVRWDHPEQGYISPQSFVQIAEDTGLINQLGEWVLKAACTEAAKWPDNLFVAVNVSPTQFLNPDFTRIVLQALAEAGLPAARLELEVTEAVFLADNPQVDDTFLSLNRVGVQLALDDFGTGYSSLAYLERAPFDKLKIDRTFVKGACLEGSRNLPILEAIVSLAHRLNMQTTAEGAETHQELELIRALECTYVQGFIFGRPMRAADALTMAKVSCQVDADGFAVSRAPRHRLIKRATAHVGGQTLPVTIRNISSNGALIEIGRDLEPATLLRLEMAGFNLIEMEVKWSRDGKAGVRFVSEFDLRGLLSTTATRSAAA